MKKTALFFLMLCMGSALTLKAQNTDVSGIDNVLYITPFSVEPGTTEFELKVCMKNTAEIRGLQFDLYLPEGASIAFNEKGKFVNVPKFNEGRLPEDDEHTIQGKKQTDGAIRFLINSEYSETFTGNDGLLFTVKVALEATMAQGEYPIVMKNIKLSESDISTFYLTEEVKTTMTYGTPTAIKSISASKQTKGIYNVAGQQVEMQKGINIVDGKKVMVK